MIKTNGGSSPICPTATQRLTDETMELLKAVHDDTVYDFLGQAPDLDHHREGLSGAEDLCRPTRRVGPSRLDAVKVVQVLGDDLVFIV